MAHTLGTGVTMVNKTDQALISGSQTFQGQERIDKQKNKGENLIRGK